MLVTGLFAGVLDVSLGALASTNGTGDILVAKFAPDGAHLWSKAFGSTSDDWGHRIASDASGNVAVTGQFETSVDFGGGALVNPVPQLQGTFVAKFDQDGAHLWSTNFDGTGVQDPSAMAVDANGNVLLASSFSGTIAIGGVTLASTFGSRDIFVAKFNPSGVPLWSTRIDGRWRIAGCCFRNRLQCGRRRRCSHGVLRKEPQTSAVVRSSHSRVRKTRLSPSLPPAGAHLWSKAFGGTARDEGRALATDANGFVFVAGRITGSVDFGDGPRGSSGLESLFLLKLEP